MAAATSLEFPVGQPDPLNFPSSWDHIIITGPTSNGQLTSPGIIPANGIQGFDRRFGWHFKKGKGSIGETATFVNAPNAKGKITFHLASTADFIAWANFLPALMYQPGKSSDQANEIYHPALAALNIAQVVTEAISPIRHMGKGLYVVEVELHEWTVVPQVNVTQTPDSAGGPGTATLANQAITGAGSNSDSQLEDLTLQAQAMGNPKLGEFVPGT
jgi:hypothetical protein